MGGHAAVFTPMAEAMASPSVAVELDEAHAEWTAFYRQEYARLAGVMFAYTGDRELGREIAQEAMAQAWRHWRSVGAFENPAGWTYRVGMNLANSAWRRKLIARRAHSHRGHEVPVARDVSADDLAVRAAVESLPPRQRSVILLRYFADLPVEEVARHMRCRPGTVTALTSKAIAKLRHCAGLAGHEGGHDDE